MMRGSSVAECWAHNPEVAGSNPAPASNFCVSPKDRDTADHAQCGEESDGPSSAVDATDNPFVVAAIAQGGSRLMWRTEVR